VDGARRATGTLACPSGQRRSRACEPRGCPRT
jgi:hypothetical protein